MSAFEWLFGVDQRKTVQRQEMRRLQLYQSIQNETDRHNEENKQLIDRYKRLYEAFYQDQASDKNFREALDCLCSYYYEWCRYNDACTEIKRKYDEDLKAIAEESLPLIHRIAIKLIGHGEEK